MFDVAIFELFISPLTEPIMYLYVFLRISLFTGIHTRKERYAPSEDAQQIWFKNGVNNRWKRFPPTKIVTFGYEKRRSD